MKSGNDYIYEAQAARISSLNVQITSLNTQIEILENEIESKNKIIKYYLMIQDAVKSNSMLQEHWDNFLLLAKLSGIEKEGLTK